MAAIEQTSKKVLETATKYSRFNRKKLDALEDSAKDGLCAAIRSMAMSLITQAPDKHDDGIIVLDICCSAEDRLAAQTFANAIARTNPEKSMEILSKIKHEEILLDGGTAKSGVR